MPDATCFTCRQPIPWCWEDAFDKFGFGDGDFPHLTEEVVTVLIDAGYEVISEPWGCHNETIVSITRDGIEQVPADAKLGYDDPRCYLPAEIIAILDRALPSEEAVS